MALLGVAGLATWVPGAPVLVQALREPLVAAALIVLLAAWLRRPNWLPAASSRLCLLILSLLASVGLAEGLLRAAGFDFRRQQVQLERTPPFWRLPRVPTGTVYFRREGEVTWTGQVIRTQLERMGFPADAYAEEPVVTVRYDALGFRNEPRPAQWEIAVAGDSCTELGTLAYEDLFTTRLARGLGCRVLNLGVAGTGPLSYVSYLEDYGFSPATRDVVAVFFEGNDLENLRDELRAERAFAATGRRPLRPLEKQTSLLRALGEWLAEPRSPPASTQSATDAHFLGRAGEVPVTLGLPPPGPQDLDHEVREAIEEFARRYARLAQRHQVRAWLAYLPAKRRVLDGYLRFTDQATPQLREWRPDDFPEVLGQQCTPHGIRFVDLTPALVRHTRETGELVFSHLYDSHLNARGSHVVAETLAETLRGP